MRVFLSLLLLLSLSGCGYRLMGASPCADDRTITLPYVEGDLEGYLTAEIVEQLSALSSFYYCRSGGAFILQVKICGVDQYNVGFEYDTDDAGMRTQRIVPNEGRLIAVAEVEVINAVSGCVVLGPQRIIATVDFDYDPLSTENQLAIFSLGQFTQIDLAEDTAIIPLYRKLARKIVNYLSALYTETT